ncbi:MULTISPECIES: gephyrin-like molybdotransferase Glp [unclassified Iodidimonas]|jgi:molybdopterin molybdotransferase|uniref:molybdopterin molybdotransferase MoeA n=1 Tax=unclassified Iodidimonas TaxID=2626145 RepID=UPI002482D244|nr:MULTISPECIES: gephyrin-like molybdotransferase Glp [unclassified Iodidimonas]
MISVEEARRTILEGLAPQGRESLMLMACADRVLAAPVLARRTQPPADFSAMDGYAIRAADSTVPDQKLELAGVSRAGAGFDGPLPPKSAIRIFTGAPLPDGADAVIMQEQTESSGDQHIILHKSVQPGANIRRKGLDFTIGDPVLDVGTSLFPRHLAVIAAANVPWVEVYRKPRIALLSTGDELVQTGETVEKDAIIDSISPALSAMIIARGGDVVHLPIARDQPDQLASAIAMARGCDLLVTVGGASVGDYDLVAQAMQKEKANLAFWKVALKPGKPIVFGRLRDMPLLGLPGNPVSALVCALLFLGPAIDALAGRAPRLPHPHTACLAGSLAANGPREAYLRAFFWLDADGHAHVKPLPKDDSSVLSIFAQANTLILRPPHAPKAETDDPVTILLLDQQCGV